MILKNGFILNKYYLNSTLNKYNSNLSSGGQLDLINQE